MSSSILVWCINMKGFMVCLQLVSSFNKYNPDYSLLRLLHVFGVWVHDPFKRLVLCSDEDKHLNLAKGHWSLSGSPCLLVDVLLLSNQ